MSLLRPALLGLIAVSLATAAPNESTIALLYARGLAGDKAAVIDCIAALKQVLAQQPNDHLARVYLGSAETLRSRDLSFGLTKWRMLQTGIAEMEKAAAAAPEDARVQLLRAITYESFPAILGRREQARLALEKLVAAVERDPQKLSLRDRQLLYLNAGKAEKISGNRARATILWQRGAALAADPNADPRLGAELRAALRER